MSVQNYVPKPPGSVRAMKVEGEVEDIELVADWVRTEFPEALTVDGSSWMRNLFFVDGDGDLVVELGDYAYINDDEVPKKLRKLSGPTFEALYQLDV